MNDGYYEEEGFTTEDFFQFFADTSARHGFSGYGYEKTANGSSAGGGFGQDHAPPPPPKAANGKTEDGHVEFPVTLEDLYKGKVVKFTSKRNKLCSKCKGSGGKPKAKARKCAKCEGQGSVKKQFSLTGISTWKYVECSSCKGRGELFREKDRCKTCSGGGLVEETKILEAYIPRGATDGHRVVLEGEADEEYGKKTGAVVIEVQEQKHAVFERRGEDLYATVAISLAEAVCGLSRVVLSHLDGRGMRVNTPPGTVIRPNQVIKVVGEGMPIPRSDRCGDLYLHVDIQFPPTGWLVESSELRKLRSMLPELPTGAASPGVAAAANGTTPESLIDDVEYTIINKDALPEYAKPQNGSAADQGATSDDGFPQFSSDRCTTQ